MDHTGEMIDSFLTRSNADSWLALTALLGMLLFAWLLTRLIPPNSAIIEERHGADLTCLHSGSCHRYQGFGLSSPIQPELGSSSSK